MYIITIITITILIPNVQLARPTLKLTFNPDEKYMSWHGQVEIQCELLNPTRAEDSAQLWHLDLKNGKRTPISRTLLASPSDDAAEIFKNNKNRRYEYVRKNYIRIRSLQMEDSAKYECNCPDCEEQLKGVTKDLYVMKLSEATWNFDQGWPLHENTKTIIKCQSNGFYPYIGHKILRDNKEMTNDGKSSLSNTNPFPQNFLWEATITPTAEWHNTTLLCSITQGNQEQTVSKTLDVLFTPHFLTCAERQYVDPRKDQSSIECSYRGNPQPKLTWLRQSDQKLLTSDNGITIDIKDEQKGKYRSIVTFDRAKLITIPLLPTNKTSEENYYQQLLNNGFIVKLTVNNNDKGTRLINIVRDASQIQAKFINSSTTISLSTISLAFLLILHIIYR
ncbi:unnamed protein product [Adineta steineri]|uniref:Ig-like domain-containing protein n=1 Tax=Adineta steineri TaxID=433720 RepID=A0A814GXE3_9BILA|nr:unnamed protein product [Adineta steineri]CAF1001837.1 unnamed protein product [Adineta steineri]